MSFSHGTIAAYAAGVKDIRIKSWAHLNDELYRDAYDTKIERHRSPYAYRGVSDLAGALETSLTRLGDHCGEIEGHILRNFKKYAHTKHVAHDSIWNWLALAQHHGVPTRLLDWTYSPYVALHFVTQRIEDFAQDGAVWCVDYVRVKELLPARLRRLLDAEGSDVFTVEILQQAASSLSALERLSREPFAVFLEPPSIDERIVNQSALFSLISTPKAHLNDWLDLHQAVYHRIIIPAALKWEIRDKLDQANINERVLFPGLDGLSRWLRRYYMPRNDLPDK